MNLKFDEKGLIPAIVQDHNTGQVLTLAYMNKESLEITIKEGMTCFWSRSRNELWRKGAASGNCQKVVSIKADCDKDALVIEVIKNGPACHTGKESCFFNEIFDEDRSKTDRESYLENEFSWQDLYKIISQRRKNPREGSYTSYLFEMGMEKILKKIGEESTEVIIAAGKKDKEETVYEIADLAYHVMVMMSEMGIEPKEITAELAERHVIDKKKKQERMG
ncbi:MAG: bifunctional phosphoribosyl-AMP cyclohydrolase/phosphoribosyl-ATP diphosphatase HisIE [Clostridiales bacterium]|nr:bifunctional phosphoribosyl-AMP cyclohydrolase/phosphoribosyl-ATP diphosphatase HisIE [Clostridiales bacterium]